MNLSQKGGLLPKTSDPRDYALGALIPLPSLDELPEHFELPTLVTKDQGPTDMCAAFAACTLSELQEGVELSPEYAFAKAKELIGDHTGWGLQLREILKAMQKKGTIEKKDAPYSVESKDRDYLADWNNWPSELEQKASTHRKKSYFDVTGPYNAFHNARASLWYFRDKKQGIEFGVRFGWPISQILFDDVPQEGFGHAMAVVGFTVIDGKQVLIIQNSYGTDAGNKGKHYITEEVYNEFVSHYGHYMMVDIDREEVEYNMSFGIKLGDHWLLQLWKILKTFFSLSVSR